MEKLIEQDILFQHAPFTGLPLPDSSINTDASFVKALVYLTSKMFDGLLVNGSSVIVYLIQSIPKRSSLKQANLVGKLEKRRRRKIVNDNS